MVKKDWQNRWVYNEEILFCLLEKMKPEKQVEILLKVIEIISSRGYSKGYALAFVLDCRYEDAGYYSRKKKIYPKKFILKT